MGLLLVALLPVLFSIADAVDRSNFKTCDQSAFCKWEIPLTALIGPALWMNMSLLKEIMSHHTNNTSALVLYI